MLSFLSYQVKVSVLLAVFYLFYVILLKKHTLFRLNRIILLLSVALSFILPLFKITFHRVATDGVTGQALPSPIDISASAEVIAANQPWILTVLTVIYTCGAFYVFLRVIISLIGVIAIIHNGHHHWEDDGSHIVLLEKPVSPFSWMEFIVLSLDDYRDDQRAIIEHEKIHVDLRHSLDILFMDLVSIVQWYNPIVWLLKAELSAQHEYEVDSVIVSSGFDSKSYQYLLVDKAMKVNAFFVANNINDSNLKNRIKMMDTERTHVRRAWLALYLIPLVCLSLLAMANTDYVQPESSSSALNTVITGSQEKPLLIIDGVEHPYEDFSLLDVNNIVSVSLVPDSLAVITYGERATNGAMVIETNNEE